MILGATIEFLPEQIGAIGAMPITNTLFTGWIAMIILIAFGLFATFKLRIVPRKLQSMMEIFLEGFYDLIKSIVGSDKKTRKFFPFVATLFLYILFSNWLGLFPGIGSITVPEVGHHEAVAEVTHHGETDSEHGVVHDVNEEHTETHVTSEEELVANTHEVSGGEHQDEVVAATDNDDHHEDGPKQVGLLRPANTDLNMTLALAFLSVLAAQIFGIGALGVFKYGGKFITFKDPISFFVGILELILEVAKIVSFAFRLFGNMFAGEVLLIVASIFMAFLLPLPFMFLETFVSVIQALVFAMLSVVFFKVATEQH